MIVDNMFRELGKQSHESSLAEVDLTSLGLMAEPYITIYS